MVTIDIDLNAGDTTAQIASITAALETLEAAADDVDIDLDQDITSMAEELEDFAKTLNDIDVGDINLVDGLDEVAEKLDGAEVNHNVNMPDGSTGDGDSSGNDPPRGSSGSRVKVSDLTPDFQELTPEIDADSIKVDSDGDFFESLASRTGFDKEQFDVVGNVPIDDLREFSEGIQHTIRNLKAEDYDHISIPGNENLGAEGLGGGFFGRTDNLDELPWQELQQRASDAGVHPPNLGDFDNPREELESRIRSQDFRSGRQILVDTDKLGKVSLSRAMEMRGETDVPAASSGEPLAAITGDTGPTPFEIAVQQFSENKAELFDTIQEANNFRHNQELRSSELTASEMADIQRDATDLGGFGGIDFGADAGESLFQPEIEELTEQKRQLFTDIQNGNFLQNAAGLDFGEQMDVFRESSDLGESITGTDPLGPGDLDRTKRNINFAEAVEKAGESVDFLFSKLNKLRPTMGKYMQLLAALIPVAVTLGVQLLGLAAAMGSVAAAGAAMAGLGLLGHGESMAASIAQAKEEVRSLKVELFETIQPTAQQFAPIQERMFDEIPDLVAPVVEEMQGLTAFEDELFSLGESLSGGLEEAVKFVVANEEAIGRLTTRFGDLIVTGALGFFKFLIASIKNNEELVIALGSALKKLAIVGFNLAGAISQIVVGLAPMFNILLFISKLLSNELIVMLAIMITNLLIIGKSAMLIVSLAGSFKILTAAIADAALMMFGYEASTWGAVAATMALIAAMGVLSLGATTIVGAAVTGGTMATQDIPTGDDTSGGDTVYNDNRDFTINNNGSTDDYATQKSVEDTIRKTGEKKSAIERPEL